MFGNKTPGSRRAVKVTLIIAAIMSMMVAVSVILKLAPTWYSWLLGLALSLVVAVELTRREEPQ